MKRSKNNSKPQNRKKKATPPTPTAPEPKLDRRAALGRMAKMALGVAVVGGGAGLLLTRAVKADMREHDLSRIGQGVPMVVQVHDPNCPTCLSLQTQVRKAMRAFGDDELQYAVASLDKTEGRRLAIEHGVGKITLLLFDAKGVRQEILHGVRNHSALESTFRRHAKSSS